MQLRRGLSGSAILAFFSLVLSFFPFGALSAQHTQVFELSIVGTSIEFDENGLPQHLEGLVYYRGGPKDDQLAGTYKEDLTPLIHPDFGFIGTTGESVFTFVNKNTKVQTFGKVVTSNRSFIVGVDPGTGELSVNSTGQIVEGTRKFKHVIGGIMSSSIVILGEDFQLNVTLTLSFSH